MNIGRNMTVKNKNPENKRVRGENPQGVGMLDVSFKDFQGVLERLTHGSYVHRSDHTAKNKKKKKKKFVKWKKRRRERLVGWRKPFWAIFLTLVSVRVTESEEKRGERREKREKESASCCFYAVLESQDGGIVRTRVRINTVSLPLFIQKNIYIYIYIFLYEYYLFILLINYTIKISNKFNTQVA